MSSPRFALPSIRARLAGRIAQRYSGPAERHAAVAALLRPEGDDTEVLLIRRAERIGDPWSGHMALPGGHAEPYDADLTETACRETLEEVGIPLARADLLGPLDEYPASARGVFTGMVIAPFVFALPPDAKPRPNYEVAEVLWASLRALAAGEADAIKEVTRQGERMRFPGFAVGEHVVWGLTHRVLQALLTEI